MNSNGNEWWKNVSDKGQSAKANVSGFFKKIKTQIAIATCNNSQKSND